jgi:ATP-dependent DNA helicase RecG
MKASEIAKYLNKGDDYIKRKYLSDMIKEKQLCYLYPEMINHPEQAYKIQETNNE